MIITDDYNCLFKNRNILGGVLSFCINEDTRFKQLQCKLPILLKSIYITIYLRQQKQQFVFAGPCRPPHLCATMVPEKMFNQLHKFDKNYNIFLVGNNLTPENQFKKEFCITKKN